MADPLIPMAQRDGVAPIDYLPNKGLEPEEVFLQGVLRRLTSIGGGAGGSEPEQRLALRTDAVGGWLEWEMGMVPLGVAYTCRWPRLLRTNRLMTGLRCFRAAHQSRGHSARLALWRP